jgi:hypothetical protein
MADKGRETKTELTPNRNTHTHREREREREKEIGFYRLRPRLMR